MEDGVVPGSIVYTCKHYRREMRGISVPRDVYVTVVGTDLIRNPEGNLLVLESAGSQRGILQAHKPQTHEADIPRPVSKMPGAADRAIQPGFFLLCDPLPRRAVPSRPWFC